MSERKRERSLAMSSLIGTFMGVCLGSGVVARRMQSPSFSRHVRLPGVHGDLAGGEI